MHLRAAPVERRHAVLWLRPAPARRWLAAHVENVAGRFAAAGWRVERGAAPEPRDGESIAVLDDPWAEPLPEQALALAAAGAGEPLWRVPSVSGLAGDQGWSAARGPFTLGEYRRSAARTGRELRRAKNGASLWSGFAVAPAAAAAELLARGWPPLGADLAWAPGVRMYRYGDPADHDRGELGRFLPDADGLFVDIGCGTGRLAARLRRSGRRVVGIEPDPELAREAAARLDEVIALPVEEALDRLAGTIQCAILADVLEHTTDPADVLRRVVARLAPEGRLVVSFPNAAWAPYVRALAAGRWDVTLAGGQARDHFAQFTPSSFAALAAACGATVERLEPLGDGLPFGLRLWSRLAAWSAGGEARHLEGAQWVATLRRREG